MAFYFPMCSNMAPLSLITVKITMVQFNMAVSVIIWLLVSIIVFNNSVFLCVAIWLPVSLVTVCNNSVICVSVCH
ncbi:hypothetical protein XENTR_v10022861 [Xenopus tropicalis]|nr:hypothetical protein XENTR_v10022861 [Xenopus tropicalis]